MQKISLDKIKKSLIKSDKNSNKKNIENVIFIIGLLIVVLIAINYFWKDDDNSKNSNKVLADENIINVEDANASTDNLEQRIKNILSGISGVGDVDVLITYSESSSINPIYNEDYNESTTNEEDTSGGKRSITTSTNSKEVVVSNNEIITKSVSSPTILGAVVTASGAREF